MDKGKLSRRDLLRLAGVAAAGVVVAACQPGTKPPAGKATEAPAGEPAKATTPAELRFIKLSMNELVGGYLDRMWNRKEAARIREELSQTPVR